MPPPNRHTTALKDPPAGEPPALSKAFLDHRDWLTALLARRYGRPDAEDLAQDTFLRVRAYVPPAPVRSPRSLLARVALNLARNRLRKHAREILVEPDDPALSNLALPSQQDEAVLFEQLLLALPQKLRDVLVLTHVRGLTYKETAQVCGVSEKAVEKRMNQALAKCREMARR